MLKSEDKRYKEYGFDGLRDKKPSKPQMPNQTPVYIEKEVLNIVRIHPEYGPQRLSRELRKQDISLSNTGVYKILNRKDLKEKAARFNFAKLYNKKSSDNAIDMVETMIFPVFKLLEIDIKAITTNAGKEYTTNYKNSKHHYEDFIESNKIRRYIVTGSDNDRLDLLNKLNKEIYDHVYIHFIDNN